MSPFRIKPLAYATLAAIMTLFTSEAVAQTNIAPPPEKFLQSPGGVDMRSGRYIYSQTDLSIGGLELTRTMPQQVVGHVNPFADFSHNWDVMVSEKRININEGIFTNTIGQPDYQIEFAFGGRSQTFRASGGTLGGELVSRAGYAAITFTAPGNDRSSAATVYTLQTGDGTTAVFRPMGSADCSTTLRCAYASQITNADGTSYSLEYDNLGGANTTRLRSITSNRGYAMLFEYDGMAITKACVLNLTLTTKPANNVCPSGVPTAVYAYDSAAGEGRLSSVTDASGAVWGFVNGPTSIGFVKPGQSQPWLTNNFYNRMNDDGQYEQIMTSQSFADGQSYTYGFGEAPFIQGHIPQIAGGSFTNAQGKTVTLAYDFPTKPYPQSQGHGDVPCGCIDEPASPIVYQITPGPVTVTDELGRTTTYDYCDPNAMANLPPSELNRCYVMPMPVSTTDPGGFKTDMVWDMVARNLMQTTRHSHDPNIADVVVSATYNCGPPTIRYCTKPLSVTDANSHTTTYTYSPDHGGVLTETDPAVNGVAPQKRYTYAQRYAWVSNGAGGYVQAATPVWVLTQMSFCKAGAPAASGTGCANGPSDEVITTYDYGPDSGPNNLLLRGTVVDAGGLSLRTCMAYDVNGNKISETRPRAGLTSCP